MMILMLVSDDARRERLATSFRAMAPDVQCIQSGDDANALLATAPGHIDLVVLDPALLQRSAAARLVDWWRAAPWGELIVLQPDPQTDFEVSQSALLKVLS